MDLDPDLQPYPGDEDFHRQQHQDEEQLEQEEEEEEERDEIEDILNEELPPMADDSDDETYEASDEDEDVDVEMSDGEEAGRDRDRHHDHDQYQRSNFFYEEQETRKGKGKDKGKQAVRERGNYDDGRYHHHRSSPPPSSSPPSYRPNRYHGPASTWRFWTREERQTAEALETIRARDLSVHLFNAFALRKRAREMRKRFVEDEDCARYRDVEVEDQPFVPPARWTAWPMPANEVPRPGEYERMLMMKEGEDEAWTFRMPPDPRPSAELEENLIAVMMRIAKERFWAREWAVNGGGDAPLKKESQRGDDEDHDAGDPPGPNNNEEEEGEGEGGWKSEPESERPDDKRPVVQTDDDKSRRQLRPLARQIIAQLDSLLMSLHNARKASIAPDDSSASEMMTTDTESVASGRYISPRKRRRTEGATDRSRSRGRKRTRTASASGAERPHSAHGYDNESGESAAVTSFDESNPSSRATSRSASRGKNYSSRSRSRLRLGLRDWSDVLGIASMTGWPTAAVMRAARRCADLFGEDMVFQTLEEGSVQRVRVKGGHRRECVWKYVEPVVEEKAPRPAPAPSASRSRSRARHVSAKREDVSISTTAASATAADEKATETAPQPRKRGRRKRAKEELVCPVKRCPRHVDGFSRTWNLNLHMKRVHPGYSARGGGGGSHLSAAVVTAEDDETEQEGVMEQ